MKHLLLSISFLTLSLCLSAKENPTIEWEWARRAWKGNDKPFITLRHDINKQADDGKLTDEVVAKWKAAYQKNLANENALFRWAFSAYRREWDKPTKDAQRLRGVLEGFQTIEHVKHTSTYNFVRLKFLIMAPQTLSHELLPVGKRLLEKRPDDYYVKLCVAEMLYYSVPAEWSLKQRYIAELRKQNPTGWKPKDILADVYYNKWFFKTWDKTSTGRQQADRSIAEIRRLSEEKPVNPYFQKLANDYMERIQKIQGEREKRRNESGQKGD